MIWLLSAFKPKVSISIQAWFLLKHTRHTLGVLLSTDVPKCLIGYHRYLPLLASHRLDPCEALNLGSVCSWQLHGNMGPCSPTLPSENFNSHIEVQLPVELENTHLLCSPTLISGEAWVHWWWKTVCTLYGDTCYVRTSSCFKCILNLEFLGELWLACEFQVQCS